MIHSFLFWFYAKVLRRRIKKYYSTYIERCLKCDEKGNQCHKPLGHTTSHRFDDEEYNFKYVKLTHVWSNDRSEGFNLKWNTEKIGFGELSFVVEDGKTVCLTECMSKNFIAQAVTYWLGNIEYRDE